MTENCLPARTLVRIKKETIITGVGLVLSVMQRDLFPDKTNYVFKKAARK